MTSSRDSHRDDQVLQALFDRTAEQPTGVQLTKLAARAAEVPDRPRSHAWWPAWVVAPALAAAAAVAMVVVWPPGERDKLEAVPSAHAVARRATPGPSPSGAAKDGDLTSYEVLFPEAPTAMVEVESDDFDPLGGVLDAPDDDDDLDAWLAAADEILGDG